MGTEGKTLERESNENGCAEQPPAKRPRDSKMDEKHRSAAVASTTATDQSVGVDVELEVKDVLVRLIKQIETATEKDEKRPSDVRPDGERGDRVDGFDSPIPGEREDDYVSHEEFSAAARNRTIKDALAKLAPEFQSYDRMFKSIPVPAREAACKIAAVPLKAFARAYYRGDREAAYQALLSFCLIPRQYFTRERGGTSRSVHKKAVKQLKSRLNSVVDHGGLNHSGSGSDPEVLDQLNNLQSSDSEIESGPEPRATHTPPPSPAHSPVDGVIGGVTVDDGWGLDEPIADRTRLKQSATVRITKKPSLKRDEEKRVSDGIVTILKDLQRHGVKRAVKYGLNATNGDVAHSPLTEDDIIECERLTRQQTDRYHRCPKRTGWV